MSFIRTEQQTALNDLLVATEKSADHLRDAAAFLDDAAIEHELKQMASQREELVQKLKGWIFELGDMPSAPDPDAETSEILIHRLSALFGPAKKRHVLQQRLDMENKLQTLVQEVRQRNVLEDADNIASTLLENSAEVVAHLQGLMQMAEE